MRHPFILSMLITLLLGTLCRAEEPPVWIEGFETESPPFELELCDGAEGTAGVVEDKAHGGKRSLLLTKTNAKGFMVVRITPQMQWKPKVRYRVGGHYHAVGASPSHLLLFRLSETPHTGDLTYDSIDRTAGLMGQTLLGNAPPGHWDRRVGHRKLDKPNEQILHIVLLGPPCKVWLDDLFVTAQRFRPSRHPINIPDIAFTDQQVREIFARRKNVSSRIAVINGRSAWTIDGRIVPPVFYKSPTRDPESANVCALAGADVNIFTAVLRLDDHQGRPGIWRGPGEYDFARVDHVLETLFRKNPHGFAILNFIIRPYKDWGENTPDEVLQNRQGLRAYTTNINVEGFTDDRKKLGRKAKNAEWYPSHHSVVWQKDVSQAMVAILEHIRTTPYHKAVVGAFLNGGHDAQFQVHRGLYDYSPAAQRAFRDFCRREYATIKVLNTAWGTSYKSFDDIAVPANPRADGIEVMTPVIPRNLHSEYMRFRQEYTWALRDRYARTVKNAIGKPIVVFAYANPADQYRMGRLPRMEYLDGAGSISYYPYRRPGWAPGHIFENTFRTRGKMHFTELDLRSWVGSRYPDEVKQAWMGAGENRQMWRNNTRKLVGRCLVHQSGFWWYSMNNYFADRELLSEMRAILSVCRRLWNRPPPTFRPDVCIIRSERARHHYGSRQPATGRLFSMQLETAAVPYETHDIDDVLADKTLQDYKVYAFVGCRWMSTKDRKIIREKLQRDGRMLIWVGDSGYIDEAGLNVEAMSRLTGFPLATKPEYARARAFLGGENTAWPGEPEPIGSTEQALAAARLRGVNPYTGRSQVFWIEETGEAQQGDLKILGRYVHNRKPAVAVRKMGDWTSVMVCPIQGLSATLLNHLARRAGAFVAGEPGPYLLINDRFCSIHGMREGPYTLHLPPGCTRLIDVDTGEVVADGANEAKIPLSPHRTDWYFVESAPEASASE